MDNIKEFLSDDRFVGVKHTFNDYFALEQFKAAFPDKLVYNGYDEMLLAGLSMGADGAIGSTFNFMAEKFIKIRELVAQNDLTGAEEGAFGCSNAAVVRRDIIKMFLRLGECSGPFLSLRKFYNYFCDQNALLMPIR